MDFKKPLIIGYSGSLSCYDPQKPLYQNNFFHDWFWTYTHLATDPSTRSGYFLFKALRFLTENYHITGDQLQVHLWGNIESGNLRQVQEMKIEDMVKIDGYHSKTDSLEKLESCDMLFLPLESETKKGKPLFIPGKLYEYLKIGKPVLSLSGKSDCLDILSESGLGINFDPHDTKRIADKLAALVSDRSSLDSYIPNNDYIGNYSFRNITRQLAEIFDDVLKKT